MKMSAVRDFETAPVSLRRAWDMRRACRPMWDSPISPSSSALGTSAATERNCRCHREPHIAMRLTNTDPAAIFLSKPEGGGDLTSGTDQHVRGCLIDGRG